MNLIKWFFFISIGEENKCSSNPCNAGACLQISVPPKYKCSCQGTGFYGLNCEKSKYFLISIILMHRKFC